MGWGYKNCERGGVGLLRTVREGAYWGVSYVMVLNFIGS